MTASPYNSKIAAKKTAQEKKQRRAHQKYMAEVRRHGKAIPSRRMPEAPLSRLKRYLCIWTFSAADDIVKAYQQAAGAVITRDPDDVRAVDLTVRADAADDYMARQSDLARCYQEWKTDLHGQTGLVVAQQVLFAEKSLRSLDTLNRWRKGTAMKFLVVALRHFAALRGNVPRGAHDWKLVISHREKEAA